MSPRKKRAKKYRFELSAQAIVAIALLSFCLFLWMFLFGLWLGQGTAPPVTREKVDLAKPSISAPQLLQSEKKKIIH